ncbi:MAG: ACP S-malonyltransferase [Acidimicrobiia bacterium]|nr:MAG: ACP S-malonyltransferase [Acidimicrobiia bacterium]
MPHAVLFPGQGSQFVGMGADLFDAMPDLLGDSADAVLGWSLRSVCLEGPEEALTRTEVAQPALFALGFALFAALSRVSPSPAAAAGHSLGEYTALAAAGVLGFSEGLALVAARGRAMSTAADVEPSGMAALLGAGFEEAEGLAAACRGSGGRLWVANMNAPGQAVVAGGAADLEWAAAHASDHGIRRVIPLKVSGAFHSPFMEPAAADLAEAVATTRFGSGAFPVWSNATAAPHGSDPRSALLRQLTSPVLFAKSLDAMAAAGIGTFVHVGPGDVTAGLARRSVEGAEVLVVSTLADVGEVAQRLAAVS